MMKVLAAILLLASLCRGVSPTVDSGRFRIDNVSETSLGIWESDKLVLVYNHGLIGKSGQTSRASYVHPIYGLDGEALTDDFPADHVYHRGLYWAWPHVTIDGKEVDLWSLKGIRIDFKKWLKREARADSATLAVENEWIVDDKAVVREEVTLKVHRARGDGRFIDVHLKWTPLGRPLTLRGAEGKSYGGLTLRFAPRTRTVITTPEGVKKDDLLEAKLLWADLSADFAGPGMMSGITLVPELSPDSPHTWMTRHYGLLAVGWPGVNAKTFPANRPFTHRATLYIHRHNPEAHELQRVHSDYIRSRSR